MRLRDRGRQKSETEREGEGEEERGVRRKRGTWFWLSGSKYRKSPYIK